MCAASAFMIDALSRLGLRSAKKSSYTFYAGTDGLDAAILLTAAAVEILSCSLRGACSIRGDRPVYSISVVARMLEVPVATLRTWEDR